MKIGLQKWNFFGVKEFFSWIFDFKNGCKNEFSDTNENLAADSKIGPPLKIDFRADWTHESDPTARESNSPNILDPFTENFHLNW